MKFSFSSAIRSVRTRRAFSLTVHTTESSGRTVESASMMPLSSRRPTDSWRSFRVAWMSRWPCEILVRPSIWPGTHWLPGVPGVDGCADGAGLVGAGALGVGFAGAGLEGAGAGTLGSAEAVGTAGTVGTSLGDTDGTVLGSAEGASLGASEGASLGSALGASVGATVGSALGDGSTGAGFGASLMGALSGANAPCAVYLVPGS